MLIFPLFTIFSPVDSVVQAKKKWRGEKWTRCRNKVGVVRFRQANLFTSSPSPLIWRGRQNRGPCGLYGYPSSSMLKRYSLLFAGILKVVLWPRPIPCSSAYQPKMETWPDPVRQIQTWQTGHFHAFVGWRKDRLCFELVHFLCSVIFPAWWRL